MKISRRTKSSFRKKSSGPRAKRRKHSKNSVKQIRKAMASGNVLAKLKVGAQNDQTEVEADKMAESVISTNGTTQRNPDKKPTNTTVKSPPNQMNSLDIGFGSSLADEERHFYETRFNYDFSSVKIHTNKKAQSLAKSINAKAFTLGNHIAFGKDEFQPGSQSGKKLMAHELAHVTQQQTQTIRRETDEEELDREYQSWVDENPDYRTSDINDTDYAFSAQEYAGNLTTTDGTTVKPKPTKKNELEEWKKDFKQAYILAKRILTSEAKHEQKHSRALMIIGNLAQAGFVAECVELIPLLKDSKKTYAYEELVRYNLKSLDATQVKTVSDELIRLGQSQSDHSIMKRLVNSTEATCKSLGKSKLLVVIQSVFDTYKSESDFLTNLAKILIYYPTVREDFSSWLYAKDKDYLFSILDSEYFVEPGYGGSSFEEGKEPDMAKDMPWVYKYKQKYYVDYLVELSTKVEDVEIKRPKSMQISDLKKWLESNTENIAAVAAKLYPTEPAKIIEIYKHIADIFLFHVDRGDVQPNLEGHLNHLPAGKPNNMRLKADCDVLATYAMRLLSASNFTPVGYLIINPTAGSAHVVALLKKDKDYYVVNNKDVTKLTAGDLDAALVAARDDALGVYEALDEYQVYYAAALAKGAMPATLPQLRAEDRKTKLEPAKKE